MGILQSSSSNSFSALPPVNVSAEFPKPNEPPGNDRVVSIILRGFLKALMGLLNPINVESYFGTIGCISVSSSSTAPPSESYSCSDCVCVLFSSEGGRAVTDRPEGKMSRSVSFAERKIFPVEYALVYDGLCVVYPSVTSEDAFDAFNVDSYLSVYPLTLPNARTNIP